MKLILISRVSDEDQIKSLPAQELKLRNYAADKDPTAEYYEFQESAHKDTRKKFAELVEHIKEQKELVGVCWVKIDRYTRDQSQEEVKALTQLVKAGKIHLIFIDDNLTITKDSPAADLFRLSIGMALGKYYSDSIRDNVARRYSQMLHDGIWVGRAPLGYLNVNTGTFSKPVKGIIIDEDRAPHIITIFEKRALGLPYEAITKLVNEAGLRSKSGKPMSRSNIEHILGNSFYHGTMVFMEKKYPHKYPPLITPELFEICQHVNRRRYNSRTVYKKIPFVFNGFVRCSECGCSIGSYISRNNVYLKCSKAKYKECKNVNTAQKIIMPQVEEMLRSIALSDENFQKLVEVVKEKYGDQQQFVNKITKETRDEYDAITQQLKTITYERLESLKTGKGLSAELYDEIVEELTEKQQKLNSKLTKLTNYNKSYLTTASHLLDLGQKANQLFKTADSAQKQMLLKGLAYNVEMFDRKLSYKLVNCYQAFKELNETTETELNDAKWYPGLELNQRP